MLDSHWKGLMYESGYDYINFYQSIFFPSDGTWQMCVFHQDSISKFVSELKEQGVFAKEVRSAGVAFHSYYMASIAPTLLAALKKVCSSDVFKQYATVTPTVKVIQSHLDLM